MAERTLSHRDDQLITYSAAVEDEEITNLEDEDDDEFDDEEEDEEAEDEEETDE